MRWQALIVAAAAAVAAAGCSDNGDGSNGNGSDTTVVNTETSFTDGVLRVAGLELSGFDGYEVFPTGNFTMVPTNWPTLSGVTLSHAVDPFGEPEVGAGVLAQQELGLERADEIIEAGFRYPGMQAAAVLSSGQVEGVGSDVHVCSPPRARSAVTAPPRATPSSSSAATAWPASPCTPPRPVDYPLDTLVGDIVEEICGARPTDADT